jgi:short-subunit dehydrogenase
MHGASKRFSSFLLQGLHYEHRDQVDCLAWHCGKTATRMLKEDPTAVDVQEVVTGMLREIGDSPMSTGCFRHTVAAMKFSLAK